MKNKKLLRLILTALFTALTTVATAVVQIPSPMQGYVNLGDAVVLLSAWLLGPIYGSFAAGVGSLLADLLAGYAHYAPGTLVIKLLSALIAAVLFSFFEKKAKSKTKRILLRVFSGISGEVFMILGYFGYSALLLKNGLSAAASIPGNCAQAVIGILIGVILAELLQSNHAVQKFLTEMKGE